LNAGADGGIESSRPVRALAVEPDTNIGNHSRVGHNRYIWHPGLDRDLGINNAAAVGRGRTASTSRATAPIAAAVAAASDDEAHCQDCQGQCEHVSHDYGVSRSAALLLRIGAFLDSDGTRS